MEACFNEKKASVSNSLTDFAPYFASNSIKKHFYPNLTSFQDELSGSVQVEYILKKDIKKDELSSQMKEIFKNIFNKKRLNLITITSEEEETENLKSELETFLSKLPSEGSGDENWNFSDKHYEAFAIPGEVQYNYAGLLLKNLPYHGSSQVYTQYLFGRYLIPRLREQGGAYGSNSHASSSGVFMLSTYRDPNLKSSFQVFENIPSFMKKEDLSDENLKPFILGALKPYYKDTSVAGKTNFMTELYLTEKTWDDYMKLKKEILNTKKEDFDKITLALEKELPQAPRSVSGNKIKIKEEAPYFKEVLTLT